MVVINYANVFVSTPYTDDDTDEEYEEYMLEIKGYKYTYTLDSYREDHTLPTIVDTNIL